MGITLEQARSIIAAASEHGRRDSLPPLAVAVLDAGGHLVAFERQDGASNMRFQIANGKAHGALALGVGSRKLMARAERQPYFIDAVTAAIGGALVPVPGGVLIRDSQGEIIGGVGVTGALSDQDEAAAIAGIESVGLAADSG